VVYRIFAPLQWTEILRNLSNYNLLDNHEITKCVISPPILNIQRRHTTFSKAHNTFNIYFQTLFVIYQVSEIQDEFQVVSLFPLLLEHPVVLHKLERFNKFLLALDSIFSILAFW